MSEYIKSPINYTGNKFKFIKQIIPLFPSDIDVFADIFGGSGTVLLNTTAKHYIYNDTNHYVASIFEGILSQSADDTIAQVEAIIKQYDLSKTNKEGFEKLRNAYNTGSNDWVTLYTLMCYSFNWQMRFNNAHKYNSSWGKDRSTFTSKQRANLYEIEKRIKADIKVMTKSFVDIDYSGFGAKDLLYFDPPYLNSVASYNDGKRGFEGWTAEHEKLLIDLFTKLHKQGVRFAISNNLKYANSYLSDWITEMGTDIKIHYLKGGYTNCSYHKLDRGSDIEVLITNY